MNIEKILMVDDCVSIRRLGELGLKRAAGVKPILASSGIEAVDQARTEHPDVIVLDVMMPSMDGPATLKVLRESPETSVIPVIFLTASVQPKNIDHYLSMGAIGVIAKPFDPMSLFRRIKEIVDTSCKS